MAELDREIAAYEAQLKVLEAHHHGKWVIFHNEDLVGAFDTFDNAAKEAVRLFGAGPYLIREVGAAPASLPASVMYHPLHAFS